jgi:hypothetical protein
MDMLGRKAIFLVALLTMTTACIFQPPRYHFGSTATIPNPAAGGAVAEQVVVASDGKTQHRLVSFSAEQACFASSIPGPEPQRLQAMTFTLRGFDHEDADVRTVPSINSTRVSLKGTDSEFVPMPSGGYTAPVSVLEICFANPTKVVTRTTQYMVLGAGYDDLDDHDGVWRLAN